MSAMSEFIVRLYLSGYSIPRIKEALKLVADHDPAERDAFGSSYKTNEGEGRRHFLEDDDYTTAQFAMAESYRPSPEEVTFPFGETVPGGDLHSFAQPLDGFYAPRNAVLAPRPTSAPHRPPESSQARRRRLERETPRWCVHCGRLVVHIRSKRAWVHCQTIAQALKNPCRDPQPYPHSSDRSPSS